MPAKVGTSIAASEPRVPLASRPLKTGQNFVLVVRTPRVHQLRFDKAEYAPGDRCELSISGRQLGADPLEMVVEEEREGGVWLEVDRVLATVDSEQATAAIGWSFPVPPGHAEALAAQKETSSGKLLEAAWAEPQIAAGGTHVARITAERLDEQSLVVLIEQEMPDGTWRCVSHATPMVKDGKCEVPFATPPGNPTPAGGLISCAFEDGMELGDAQTAWLKVSCDGLDDQEVQLVLEREEGDGTWKEVSGAVSTVKANAARAGLPL